jgi:hypothetical protein
MKLSEHFYLDEFLVSETAARRGIANQPSDAAILQLRALCQTVLEPLRAHLGSPIVVTSGYRSPELNRAVGGSLHSLHMQGRAADIVLPGMATLAVCEAVKRLKLPCAEIIHEYGRWAHLSLAQPGDSTKLLTATLVAGRTLYREGLRHV